MIQFSCTEIIEVDLNEGEKRIVIEAKIIDTLERSDGTYAYVKISETNSYFNANRPQVVSNAEVSIYDNKGEKTSLLFSNGLYIPATPLAKPTNGSSFTLEVKYNGQRYVASNKLTTFSGLDSLSYSYKPKDALFEEGYYSKLFAKEDGSKENYYRFYFRRVNNQIDSLYDIIAITDDNLVNGGYLDFEIGIPTQQGDRVYGTMASISKEEYNYLYNLNKQVNNPGGPFANQPENLPGNISNGALGFFGVSQVSTRYVDIR